MKGDAAVRAALKVLESWGVLLLQDAMFPSLVGLIVKEAVRGSWWSHPRGREIFHAQALVDRPDVATAKLISGKVTFVHDAYWPQLIAIGRSRQAWQVKLLSRDARALLKKVDTSEVLRASGPAARELEKRLLGASRQVHTESGAHALELTTWSRFARDRRISRPRLSVETARSDLETQIGTMNAEFGTRCRLPWT